MPNSFPFLSIKCIGKKSMSLFDMETKYSINLSDTTIPEPPDKKSQKGPVRRVSAYIFIPLFLNVSYAISHEEKSEPIINSVGMKMIRIQAGDFRMGQEKNGDFDEKPVHKVTIPHSFYISATEVTNSQYELFDATRLHYQFNLKWLTKPMPEL